MLTHTHTHACASVSGCGTILSSVGSKCGFPAGDPGNRQRTNEADLQRQRTSNYFSGKPREKKWLEHLVSLLFFALITKKKHIRPSKGEDTAARVARIINSLSGKYSDGPSRCPQRKQSMFPLTCIRPSPPQGFSFSHGHSGKVF